MLTMASEEVWICSGYDVPSMGPVFGHMLQLADGIIEHYRGDLYHDAVWLEKYAQCECEFYWAPRMTGTAIGTDRDLVARMTGTARPIYRVQIYAIGATADRWYARFTELHAE